MSATLFSLEDPSFYDNTQSYPNSMTVSGNYIAVGAIKATYDGYTERGRVYIYYRNLRYITYKYK